MDDYECTLNRKFSLLVFPLCRIYRNESTTAGHLISFNGVRDRRQNTNWQTSQALVRVLLSLRTTTICLLWHILVLRA